MHDAGVQTREIILVLCHSFFHDAFRMERPLSSVIYKNWVSSRFIANLIIERQAELPEGSIFALTSKQVFDGFASKFHGEKPSAKQRETVEILHNSICVVDGPAISNLSVDDSVFVICDTLYSRSNYEPILVTNIPKKVEKAEEFYHKKDTNAKIPYSIYGAVQLEPFLRGRFPELCTLVDKRLKNSVIQV
jgi:hypothetical protein